MKPALSLLTALALLCAPLAFSNQDINKNPGRVYYRYLNDDGVMVLHSSIPPRYIHKGYEVVSLRGEVLRVVPPAPDEEDAERIASERRAKAEQERQDALLRRRYSSLHDLDVDRHRSLLELENSINILQNTLSNIRLQIENQQAQAAAVERTGKSVTPEMLRHLSVLQGEQQDINVQIEQRREEYQALEQRFEQDRERLAELLAQRNRP